MAKHKEEPQLPPPQKPAKASQEGGEEVVAGHKFECTRSFLAQQGGRMKGNSAQLGGQPFA